jgi:hypothetical protein
MTQLLKYSVEGEEVVLSAVVAEEVAVEVSTEGVPKRSLFSRTP